jgi:hypothetical protein
LSTDTSMLEPSKVKGFRLTDTVALTALPIVAYLILFVYRLGYFEVFALPHQYIELSIGEVFSVIGGLAVSSVSLLFAIDGLTLLVSGVTLPQAMLRRYRIYAPIVVMVYLPYILGSYTISPPLQILLGILPIIIVLGDFVLPLFTHRKISGYMNKLEAADEYQSNIETNTLARRLVEIVGPKTFGALFWAAIGLYACFHLGRAAALKQVDYHITNTTPEMVVLVTLKDKVVVAPFDRVSKLVEPSYLVIDPSRENGPLLRLEAIGPLQLSKPTPTQIATPVPTATTVPSPTTTPTLTTAEASPG